MIPLKSEDDLQGLRRSGKILAQIMRRLTKAVKAGVTTAELDGLADDLIAKEGVVPAFKGYKGYPCSLCVSLNEEVVHGIPCGRLITDGDIVSIDIGIIFDGYFSDCATTIPVGRIDSRVKKLLEVTKRSLYEGIKKARPGNHLFDISAAVQRYVEQNGFSVVRQFVGHGIGRQLHEEPEIPNFGRPHEGPMLVPNMVLAIEPMVNLGTWECRILDNGWTAVTKDGRQSAHFEHTVAITDQGPEILTQ